MGHNTRAITLPSSNFCAPQIGQGNIFINGLSSKPNLGSQSGQFVSQGYEIYFRLVLIPYLVISLPNGQ